MIKHYKKILIANRGEIAVRIIRACRNAGIRSVAVYSQQDKNALHVKLADQSICIGSGSATKTYLNMRQLIAAAEISKADAIHPGYGFLSENAEFVRLCREYNIDFIGPSPELMEQMGNKNNARNLVKNMGISVIEGSHAALYASDAALREAERIGFPIMIKAAAGGGGKGMRVAYSSQDFALAFQTAQIEAAKAFDDNAMYLERLISRPRHIEVQIIADKYSNVVALGERDCSIQRNHQKLIEESPSPAVQSDTRKKIQQMAVQIAQNIGYYGVGTIELLMDESSAANSAHGQQKQELYFMEMNTRIQVEHPLTEMVTGIDLVEEMIAIAAGKKLAFSQQEIQVNGHALECRVNAESPEKNFRPSPGLIHEIHLPGGNGVRVDTAIFHGYQVPSEYDSLLAKIIVHAQNREAAVAKMKTALEETVILGIETNIDLQYKILHHPLFKEGKAHTGFLELFLQQFNKDGGNEHA